MAIKTTKLCFLLFLFSVFLVSSTFSLAEGDKKENRRDPQREYEQCQHRCRQQERDPHQQQQCERRCEEDNKRDPRQEYHQCQQRCQQQHERDPHQQQQCQRRCEERFEERQRGKPDNQLDPETEYGECLQRCQQHERDPRQQQRCQQRCQEQRDSSRGGRERYEEGEREEQRDNPYFFDERSLSSKFRGEEGRISVLERFSRRSDILSGLDNYRLACLEANPNTLVRPHHLDADAILLVVRGRGTITMVRHDDPETFNLECGDVIRVRAGTPYYLINRDNNDRLHIAKFLYTVSTPGRFRAFDAGPQLLRTFSDDILQAALNTRRERIDRVLGKQQRGGWIVRASQDQIKELTRHAAGPRQWHIGSGKSRGPYNLFRQKPFYSNKYGEAYSVTPEDNRQLRDMDVSVCVANISQGAMMGPFFNTRSTKVVWVDQGTGYVEMACPHLARRYEEGEEEHYEKVRARLSPGTGIIIPAGHPVVFVASGNENLQLFAFGINAEDNEENFLAGRERNVMQQIERRALELAFDAPGKEVEELFNSQRESIFFPGPSQRQPLNSILDVGGF